MVEIYKGKRKPEIRHEIFQIGVTSAEEALMSLSKLERNLDSLGCKFVTDLKFKVRMAEELMMTSFELMITDEQAYSLLTAAQAYPDQSKMEGFHSLIVELMKAMTEARQYTQKK
jgi:hypothetical protein